MTTQSHNDTRKILLIKRKRLIQWYRHDRLRNLQSLVQTSDDYSWVTLDTVIVWTASCRHIVSCTTCIRPNKKYCHFVLSVTLWEFLWWSVGKIISFTKKKIISHRYQWKWQRWEMAKFCVTCTAGVTGNGNFFYTSSLWALAFCLIVVGLVPEQKSKMQEERNWFRYWYVPLSVFLWGLNRRSQCSYPFRYVMGHSQSPNCWGKWYPCPLGSKEINTKAHEIIKSKHLVYKSVQNYWALPNVTKNKCCVC